MVITSVSTLTSNWIHLHPNHLHLSYPDCSDCCCSDHYSKEVVTAIVDLDWVLDSEQVGSTLATVVMKVLANSIIAEKLQVSVTTKSLHPQIHSPTRS